MPKTLAERQNELNGLFVGDTHVYIDYANIRKACSRLGWKINLRKLKKMLDATGKVKYAGFYFGTLLGDKGSEGFVARARKEGLEIVTKPVKCMNLSINVSSISSQSVDIIRNFMSETLIRSLKVEAIEYINQQLLDLNKLGLLSLEERKCNFDVEIASDMRIHHALNKAQTYCLWSGDSDFAHPILQLLENGRNVVIVSSGVAAELNDLRPDGLVIHDIRKLRDLIAD